MTTLDSKKSVGVWVPFDTIQQDLSRVYQESTTLQALDQLPSNPGRSSRVYSLLFEAYGACWDAWRDDIKLYHLDAPFNPDDVHMVQLLKESLQLYHSQDYVEYICHRALHASDKQDSDYGLEHDCPPFPDMLPYIHFIAMGAQHCAKALVHKHVQVAIHIDGGRHHADKDKAAGFCYVNDVVLSILELQTAYPRILYIDVDIHHGDGVERAFYYSHRVFTLSFHRMDPGFYPGTGSISDVGSKRGKYCNLNIPLKPGLGNRVFMYLFESILPLVIHTFQPDAVVMVCGADGLAGDPLEQGYGEGPSKEGWNLDTTALCFALECILSFSLPLLVMGGGGYNPISTPKLWVHLFKTILDTLHGTDIPIPLDIPEHTYFNEYGPDFTLHVSTSCRQDENQLPSHDPYVERVLQQALSVIKKISIK